MIVIPNLEIHVTHACNLTCKSCSHFSDQRVGKNLSLEEITNQMKFWNHRIKPKLFSILGGEPTLNKELCKIVRECRLQWPESQLQLITNGFFLHRHPDLPAILEDTKCNLEVSIHHSGQDYTEKFKPVRELLDNWKHQHNFKLHTRPSATKWRTTFEGYGSEMKPFNDGNPEESYKVCCAKNCPQIFESKIWKCPQLAYIQLMNRTYELGGEWEKYLAYRPLHPGCSDEELQQFFTTKVESACAMCPAKHRFFEIPSPLHQNLIP